MNTSRQICACKTRYDGYAAALRRLRDLTRKRLTTRRGWGKLRPYRCRVCGGWHLGHDGAGQHR